MAENERVLSGAKDVRESKVGTLSVVGMFYAICCAGAFGVEEMIPEIGPGLTILMLVVLPFFWALPYSYICAELGSARPVEGGLMLWVKEALGEFWGGLSIIINFLWGLIANTVYVVLAVGYLGKVINYDSLIPGVSGDVVGFVVGVIIVIVFYLVNVLGIKEVSVVSTFLSILVVIAFAAVAIVGIAHWDGNPIAPFMSDAYDNDLFRTLGGGLAIGIWMYSGFDEISSFGGEIEGSYKVIPRALLIVIPLMILTYVLPTVAGLSAIGQWDSWTTDFDGIGYAEVLFKFAPWGVGFGFILIAIVGQCSIFNMCVATAARAALVWSDENLGPKFIARLSRKRATPVIALTIVIIVTICLLPFNFTFLVVIDTTFCLFVATLVAISAYVLKRRIPEDEVPFKTPGGKPLHTVFVCLVVAFGILTVLLDGSDYFFGGMLVTIALPIVYIIGKKIWGGFTTKEPELYPIDKRTGLAFGDLTKMGALYISLGVFSFLSRFFLSWYEGYGGKEGWLAFDYDSITAAQYEAGEYDTWWAFPHDYDISFGFSNYGHLLNAISITAIAVIVIGIALVAIGKKLSKDDAKYLEGA